VSGRGGRRGLVLVLAVWTALAVNASILTPLFEPVDEVATLEAVTGGPDRRLFADALGLGAAPPLPRVLFGAAAGLLGLDDVRFLPRPDAAAGPGRPAYLHGADELLPFAGPARGVHVLRLLGILLGLATLAVTARLAERLRPGSGWLAAAALGCSPAVLCRFSSCSEQAVLLFTASLALLMLTRLAQSHATRSRDGLLAGLALGAAQLSAPAAVFLLLLVPAALALRVRREPGWRGAIVTLDWVLLGLLPIAGPYWAYNFVHVGGPWGVGAMSDSPPPFDTVAAIVGSVLTSMTRTLAAGAPLAAVWAGVAIAALVGLLRTAVTRKDICLRALALLVAAALVDLGGLLAQLGVLAGRPVEGPWPHLGLSAAAALLAAGLAALVPTRVVALRALPALVAGGLALLAFRAQAHELGPASWPPARARDPHFMVFDPLAPVPPERRLPTIRWVAPQDDETLPAAPVLAWQPVDDPGARFTVHLSSPGLSSVLTTYEATGLALRERYQIPPRFWSHLPPGVPVVCRVLRLPTLDEALAAPPGRLNVDQSLPLTLRRGQPPP
jgi:hypothetical protein